MAPDPAPPCSVCGGAGGKWEKQVVTKSCHCGRNPRCTQCAGTGTYSAIEPVYVPCSGCGQ